ncbi:MAG: hypothetical protein PWP21_1525 [Thermosediminibacterales bacterium]|nr:hypothetical protein [Thermosediminibacterales bacterium]
MFKLKVELQERDMNILRDIYRFNGLPLPTIIKKYFHGSTYAMPIGD